MTNLTASLTVKLIDDVTKPARSVAQALADAGKQAQAVAKAMAGSGASDRLNASLSKLKLGAKDIEQVSKAWKDYSTSAKLAANAADWTKAQASDVRRWESQTISALKAVQREEAAFARAQKKAMTPPGGHGGQHGPSQWSHTGAVGFTAQGIAAAVSAHSVFEVTKLGLEAGAERAHVRTLQRNAGMTAGEVRESEAQSTISARNAPNMSISEIMELHKEARSAVQHPKEALELLPMLAKASSVLKGMGADNANIADVVKGGESLGLMNDPRRFRAYLEGQVKAMAVMGKTITTEQIYEAAKYSKAAGATLSDRFLNTTLPSLIQEMHGSSAGDALSMLSKTLRGGLQHKHVPVERLRDIGMLEDPSKIRRSKTGQILGYTGKIVGDNMIASDPDKFAKILDEHMEAHGIKKFEDKTKFLQEALPGTAANLIRILIQQRDALAQHARLYESAPGTDDSQKNQLTDPTNAVGNLRKSFDDLGAAVSGPVMNAAAGKISALAGAIRSLGEAAAAHPITATVAGGAAAAGAFGGAGYLSYQFLNGFGLKTSATALTAAAGELSGAAGAITAAEGRAAIAGATGAVGAAGKLLKTVPLIGTALTLADVGIEVADWYKRNHPEDFRGGGRGHIYRSGDQPMDPDKIGPTPYGHWEQKAGRNTGHSRHWVDETKQNAAEVEQAIQSINTSVAPTVDTSGMMAALNVASELLARLQAISGAASGAASAVRGINVPSLGKVQRGDFSYGGVKGE